MDIKEFKILDTFPFYVMVLDPEHRIVYANKAIQKDVRKDLTDLVGGYCYRDVHGQKSPCANCTLEDALRKGHGTDCEKFDKGRNTWMSSSVHPLGKDSEDGKPLFIHYVMDITEQKDALEELRRSEEKYKNLTENSLIGVFIHQDGRYVFVNDKFAEMHGYKADELIGKDFLELVAPDSHSMAEKRSFERTQSDSRAERFTTRRLHRDGRIFWCHLITSRVEYKDKPAVMGHLIDITEQRKAEEALRESEEKYRGLYEDAPMGYMEYDHEGRVTNVNKRELEMLGYSRDEMVGRYIWDFVEEKEGAINFVKAKLSGKMPPSKGLERTYVRKDGSKLPIIIDDLFIKDKEGGIKGVRSIIQDISSRRQAEEEKKLLEAQLRQSQKMEAIGTLAGGIAHDFNNILGIILGNAEVAMYDVSDNSPAKLCLNEIRSASLRAKDLVKRILSFARKSMSEPKPISLTTVVRDSLNLLRASIPATIEIRETLSCLDDKVFADDTEISQVFLNLCTNAAHAMEESGGVLYVSLSSLDFEQRDQELMLEPGRYVSLKVSDTGIGIDPAIKDRIFDPYFTTKGVGKGTGLGLAVVHGIVKSLCGAVSVKSEKGSGTVVEVLIPVTDMEANGKDEELESLRGGEERILFIDDEESLLKMVKRTLEKLGYHVETERSPARALEKFRLAPDRFDLVITDMTMPGMTGDRLAEEIVALRSDMPVILCTGFSHKVDIEKVKDMAVSNYIEKPFVMRDFAAIVRKTLDGSKSNSVA